jgi:hypothetical protein
VLLGVVVSPIPAALTLSAPHALRGAGLIPFLMVLMVEGTAWVWNHLQTRKPAAIALVALVAATAAPYFVDFYAGYPDRAGLAFETGEGPALAMAYAAAESGGHRLLLSAGLNQPALQLMYAIGSAPPQSAFLRRAQVSVVTTRAQLDTAKPGDVLVIGPGDTPPPDARLLFVVDGGRIIDAPTSLSSFDLLRVYQV